MLNNLYKDIISAIISILGLVGAFSSAIDLKKEGKNKSTSLKRKGIGKLILFGMIVLIGIICVFIDIRSPYELLKFSHSTNEYIAYPSYAIQKDEGKAIRAVFPSTGEYAINKITLSNINDQEASIHTIEAVVDHYEQVNLPFFKFNNINVLPLEIDHMPVFGPVYDSPGTYPLVYASKTNDDSTSTPNESDIIPGNGNKTVIPHISFQSPGLYTMHYLINYTVCGQNKQLSLPPQTIYVPDAGEIPDICRNGINAYDWKKATHISYNDLEKSIINNTQLNKEILDQLSDEQYILRTFAELMPSSPPDTDKTPIVPDTEVETPKTDLSIVAENKSYHLSWTEIDEAKEYIVKRSVNKESFSELFKTSNLDYIDEDVSYGNEYWYVVDAVLSNGDIVTSNMEIMNSLDEIPEFPKAEEWARIGRILTSGEKVHLFVMPIDDPKYMLQNGLTPSTNLEKNHVPAFFPENEFVLVELPMRKKGTEVAQNKQIIYIKQRACDIYPSFSSISKPANIQGIIIADNPTLYYGPGDGYIKDTGHKVSKGTEITILYKQGDYYYMQYTDSDHDVRTWLKQPDVKIYIDQ